MSVINKMLRDLDARRADASLPDLPRQARVAAMEGTSSVMGEPQRPRTRPWLIVLLFLLGLGVLLWAYVDGDPSPPVPPASVSPAAQPERSNASIRIQSDVPQAPAAEVAPIATVPAPVTAPTPIATPIATPASVLAPPIAQAVPVPRPAPAPVPTPAAPAPAPAASVSVSAAVNTPPRPADAKPATALPVKPVLNDSSGSAASRPPLAPASEQAPAVRAPVLLKPAQPVIASSTPPATGVAASPIPAPRRQAAAKETLARAQALWQAGSRDAALDLIREARVLAERAQPLDAVTLAMLVREQAQMELAQGRADLVHDMLTRLERELADQAELWAVRGNAAQRLGRHQDSVQAYQQALKLRPGESRWLLGAAVSLAALGQLEAAAKQTELARALGPVSPEVLNYLRQAGVPLP